MLKNEPSDPGGGSRKKNARGKYYLDMLFEKFKVPRTERPKLVKEVFGIEYGAARNRVTGDTACSIDDLESLAAHLGTTLGELVLADSLGEAYAADLLVNDLRVPCYVWLGDTFSTANAPITLVATRNAIGTWDIVPSSHLGDKPARAIKQLVVQRPTTGPRIAVVDDMNDVTESVCSYLLSDGFDPHGFANFESLRQAIARRPFDGYIIDWMIGFETAASVIGDIRASDANCPIVVLTGRANDGDANVEDIRRTVADHNTMFFQKPAMTPIIAVKLAQALEHHRT